MLQMFPSFSFNEKTVGPRPSRAFLVDAVGIVGQFVRGFYNKAFPCNATEAFERYGKRNLLNGDVGMGAVYSQGAEEFVLSAVHGTGKQATKTVTLKGSAAVEGTITFKISDTRVNAGADPIAHTVTVLNGDSAKVVLTNLANLINVNGSPVTATVDLEAPDADATMVIKASTFQAIELGKLTVWFDGTAAILDGLTDAFPVTLTSTTVAPHKSLEGGYDAPTRGFVTLKNMDDEPALRLDYLYVGPDSQNVNAKVIEGTLPGQRTIVVTHGLDAIEETIKDVNLAQVEDVDLLIASKGKILFEARVLKATSPLALHAGINFSAGTSGSPVTTADYVRAITALEVEPCTYVIAPGEMPAGVDRAQIEDALVKHVEKIESEMGEAYTLRTAVTYAKPGLIESDIQYEVVPNSDRVVKVAGWATCQFAPKLKRFGVSPDALYVGKAMKTPRHISVAALEGSPSYKGIIAVDTPDGIKAWNLLTVYRMDAIVKDPVEKVYTNLNGRTTTNDPEKCYWHCFRRMMDSIRMRVFRSIYRKKSGPMGASSDDDFEALVNTILDTDMKNSVIRGYDPCVSDDSNNPEAVRNAGKRIVDFGAELIPPQDFTEVNVSRVQRATVRA